MKYMCLIYSAQASEPKPGSDEFGIMLRDYAIFTENMKSGGKYIAGDALQPTMTATTVSVRDGKTQTVDGPFAETKEQLGGYYLLECDDLDDALKCAAQIPTAKFGRVEVRPVMVFD